MFGLLSLDKPAGITSRDVVNRVERLVRPVKVGHAGTLDPLATGVLVLGLGPATRLVEYLQRMPKTYRGTFLLGRTSDTEDIEGQVIELPDSPQPTAEQIESALPKLTGTIEQVPPAFSALKVKGRRSYDLARRGQAVDLAPRPVEIHRLEIVSYAYPELTLLVRCGSGTYIRSLGRDLARSVGTDAVMSALCREAIGPFTVATALSADALTLESIQAQVLSPLLAVGEMPRVVVSSEEIRRLFQGQTVVNRWGVKSDEVAVVSERGELVAVGISDEAAVMRAVKCFFPAA